jgi:hypothetical protein
VAKDQDLDLTSSVVMIAAESEQTQKPTHSEVEERQ